MPCVTARKALQTFNVVFILRSVPTNVQGLTSFTGNVGACTNAGQPVNPTKTLNRQNTIQNHVQACVTECLTRRTCVSFELTLVGAIKCIFYDQVATVDVKEKFSKRCYLLSLFFDMRKKRPICVILCRGKNKDSNKTTLTNSHKTTITSSNIQSHKVCLLTSVLQKPTF